jgi:hypothetical protein
VLPEAAPSPVREAIAAREIWQDADLVEIEIGKKTFHLDPLFLTYLEREQAPCAQMLPTPCRNPAMKPGPAFRIEQSLGRVPEAHFQRKRLLLFGSHVGWMGDQDVDAPRQIRQGLEKVRMTNFDFDAVPQGVSASEPHGGRVDVRRDDPDSRTLQARRQRDRDGSGAGAELENGER